jgi:histidinol-phosphate aminotransferase
MFDLDKLIRPNIKALKPYASARDEFSGVDGIFLDANENPYGTMNRYPDPYQKRLKAKISHLKGIDKSRIFLGNGSDEIIDLCFRIFCEPGKSKVLNFTPTYGMYQVSAAISDVEMIDLELNSSFQIDFNNLNAYLDDPDLKMIFICSPNNPSGNLMDPQTIERIISSFGGIVIIDEAYIDFSKSNSWTKKLSEFPNLIITQTFSKAWGLAGARVGMAFTSPEIISFLNKVKPPYNISTPNQNIIMNGLKEQEKKESILEILRQEKSKIEKELKNISAIKKVFPSDANFILIKVKNADEVYQKLLAKKVILRNRNKIIQGCIRITIGTPDENKKMINELKKALI